MVLQHLIQVQMLSFSLAVQRAGTTGSMGMLITSCQKKDQSFWIWRKMLVLVSLVRKHLLIMKISLRWNPKPYVSSRSISRGRVSITSMKAPASITGEINPDEINPGQPYIYICWVHTPTYIYIYRYVHIYIYITFLVGQVSKVPCPHRGGHVSTATAASRMLSFSNCFSSSSNNSNCRTFSCLASERANSYWITTFFS